MMQLMKYSGLPTLKGGSATVKCMNYRFTHVMEDLLDAIRDGTVSVNERL